MKKGSALHNAEPLESDARLPSCLADYFTWPQVALTHHANNKAVIEPSAFRQCQDGNHCQLPIADLRAETRVLRVTPAKVQTAIGNRQSAMYHLGPCDVLSTPALLIQSPMVTSISLSAVVSSSTR